MIDSFVMDKLIKKIMVIVLLLSGGVSAAYSQIYHTVMPKYFEIDDCAEWNTGILTFKEPIDGFRLTVFKTNTPNSRYNSYPIVELAEVDITDANGEVIAYSVTTNSLAGDAGNGLAGLYDNDFGDGGCYHSAFDGDAEISPNDYVYIDFRFDKPQSVLALNILRCKHGDNFPLRFALSALGEGVKPPFTPTLPPEPNGEQGDVATGYYNITYIVDGEVYATVMVEYGTEIELPEDENVCWDMETVPDTMPAEDIVITGTVVPTAIERVEADGEDCVIYYLNGLRVLDACGLERGIYIINGKKVLAE